MQLRVEDKAYLWDLKVAANDIVDFTRGKNYESYLGDKVTRFAVERQLLVLGEVVKRLSTDFKASQPTIQWNAMIGLRNIIAHEYGEILSERIWRIATENVPTLLAQLEAILKEI